MATCVIILEDVDPNKNDGSNITIQVLEQESVPGEQSLAMTLARGISARVLAAAEAKDGDA